MVSSRKKLMVFTDWFEPAYKAGGPIRSCVNFAYHMCTTYDIYIFTGDRDLNDKDILNGIITDRWITNGQGIKIFYASPKTLNWKQIKQHINTVNPDFIYLNSMFSRYYTIYPILIVMLSDDIKSKVVLAPRGMLKSSALRFKQAKKSLFLRVFKMLNIQKHIIFHATDIEEKGDIEKIFGIKAVVFNISNFPGYQKKYIPPYKKRLGELRMIFVGRVHPIKNLHFLLENLLLCKENIFLTVIGVREDTGYWSICKELTKRFPSNIVVEFIKDVPHHQLEDILLDHHLFVLPTQGENFGHAIFEALAAGRPVLISDQTPWRNLEQYKAGWDMPLNSPVLYTNVIEKVALMSKVELEEWCWGAWKYCYGFIEGNDLKGRYLKLFS